MLIRALLAFAAAILISPLPAAQWLSQSRDTPRDSGVRSLRGTVQDADGSPAPGAVVTLKNLKTLQVLSYITQDGGKYQFNNLSTTVDYEIRARLEGRQSGKKSLSVFDQRSEAVINLKIEGGKSKRRDDSE